MLLCLSCPKVLLFFPSLLFIKSNLNSYHKSFLSLFGCLFYFRQFRKFSPQADNFVSFKIVQWLPSCLLAECSSKATFIKAFLHILFFYQFMQFSTSNTSSNAKDLLCELKAFDGHDLPADTFTINQYSFIAEYINNSGKLSFLGSVVNSSNSANLNKSRVCLS